MAEFPKQFPQVVPKNLLSYDWTDVASGVGYQLFYGIGISDGTYGSYEYILTDTTNIVGTPDAVNLNSANSFEFYLTEFNTTRTINGNAKISFVWTGKTSGTAGTKTGIITLSFKKDGTQFASKTFTFSTTLNSSVYSAYCNMEVPITKTIFPKGSVLSVNVSMTEGGPGFTNEFLWIDILSKDVSGTADQAAIDGTQTPTAFKLAIPFEI